jgi:hypothetical protein
LLVDPPKNNTNNEYILSLRVYYPDRVQNNKPRLVKPFNVDRRVVLPVDIDSKNLKEVIKKFKYGPCKNHLDSFQDKSFRVALNPDHFATNQTYRGYETRIVNEWPYSADSYTQTQTIEIMCKDGKKYGFFKKDAEKEKDAFETLDDIPIPDEPKK